MNTGDPAHAGRQMREKPIDRPIDMQLIAGAETTTQKLQPKKYFSFYPPSGWVPREQASSETAEATWAMCEHRENIRPGAARRAIPGINKPDNGQCQPTGLARTAHQCLSGAYSLFQFFPNLDSPCRNDKARNISSISQATNYAGEAAVPSQRLHKARSKLPAAPIIMQAFIAPP